MCIRDRIKSERLVPQKFTLYFAGKADTLPVLKGLNFEDKMCIRDRLRISLGLIPAFLHAAASISIMHCGKFRLKDVLAELISGRASNAVSYTHLDVYKR